MGRFLMFLGFLLIGAAVVFLLVGIFATDNPTISGAIQSFVCSPNEELVIERNRWSLPNGERGENITFFCEIEPGQQRSVTDAVVPIFIAGFAIPLMLGIFMIIAGAAKGAKTMTNNLGSQMNSYLADFDQGDGVARTVNVQSNMQNIPPETRDMIENMLGCVITNATQASSPNISLSDRLQQLEEAYEKRLISQEEYDKVRQAILDSMDD